MSRSKSPVLRTALVLGLSTALVVVVTWFVPSLSAASLNMLFRLRGGLRPPDDVVILAIDDRSLQRLGQWPWPRSVMAGVLDRLTPARPLVVGLDVIYAERSTHEADRSLAAAVARNGRVVLPVQLYEAASADAPAGLTAWLRPLPELAAAAAALGHAHVSPGVDGMVRSVQLSKADDRAERIWSFGLEALRVAEQIPAEEVEEKADVLRLGAHRIPVRREAAGPAAPGVAVVRRNEMLINYAGPAGTFHHYSVADLIDGQVPPAAFAGKIVLVGAVAESMGDARVAPFMHYGGERRQGGQEMPGVEIHANIINTVRGRLSLAATPDWAALAAALAVMLCAALTVRQFDGWRQLTILGLIFLAITLGSLYVFSRHLIIPPLVPMLTGFASVIPLLLNRSLAASRELDLKLAALVGSQEGFLSAGTGAGAGLIDLDLRLDLPQSLAWKLRAVDDLTTRLLARMSFMNRILSSMGEGVFVADPEGRIVFANREASQLFGGGEPHDLVGADFADFLAGRGVVGRPRLREAFAEAAGGLHVRLEFEIPSPEPRSHSLLLSALVTDSDGAPVGMAGGRPIGVVALISDITKRVELDRMKTETLQLVSHELRTPLTSIRGLSDALIKFPVPAGEAREMLGTIHSEAARLGETINRYLDLTRLESGAQPLHLTRVPCRQLIDGCVRNLSLLAAERCIGLASRVNPTLPDLLVDAPLLTQAVGNLLSNAIKYSPPGTEVVIAAELSDAGVAIRVRDQGLGIPEEAREKIFEKFYRLRRDTASGVVGTGLGLPLVKEIVERHGGRMSVESGPGAGSTFTIHLPLQPQAFSAPGRSVVTQSL